MKQESGRQQPGTPVLQGGEDVEPNRCHELPLKPVGGRVEYGCQCSESFWFSHTKHRKVMSGVLKFRCRICKTILAPVEIKKAAIMDRRLIVDNLDIRYFRQSEFREWWSQMSPRLLVVLDVFRARWGSAVLISPAEGALGRHLGADALSQHNVDRWGEVRAVDIMLPGIDVNLMHAMQIAASCGASGVGVYPHWKPMPGLHIDVRVDREPGNPALWGAIDEDGKQVYVSVGQALSHVS